MIVTIWGASMARQDLVRWFVRLRRGCEGAPADSRRGSGCAPGEPTGAAAHGGPRTRWLAPAGRSVRSGAPTCDPARPKNVTTLGVDEHIVRHEAPLFREE